MNSFYFWKTLEKTRALPEKAGQEGKKHTHSSEKDSTSPPHSQELPEDLGRDEPEGRGSRHGSSTRRSSRRKTMPPKSKAPECASGDLSADPLSLGSPVESVEASPEAGHGEHRHSSDLRLSRSASASKTATESRSVDLGRQSRQMSFSSGECNDTSLPGDVAQMLLLVRHSFEKQLQAIQSLHQAELKQAQVQILALQSRLQTLEDKLCPSDASGSTETPTHTGFSSSSPGGSVSQRMELLEKRLELVDQHLMTDESPLSYQAAMIKLRAHFSSTSATPTPGSSSIPEEPPLTTSSSLPALLRGPKSMGGEVIPDLAFFTMLRNVELSTVIQKIDSCKDMDRHLLTHDPVCGATLLHSAVTLPMRIGSLEVTSKLLEKAQELNILEETLLLPDKIRECPVLLTACDSGQLPPLKILLEKIAGLPVNLRKQVASVRQPSTGATALHFLVHRRQKTSQSQVRILEGIVKQLVALGIDLNSDDYVENTPLHYAARADNPITARILLDMGAAKDRKNAVGQTALDLAQACECHSAVEVLSDFKDAKKSPRKSRSSGPYKTLSRTLGRKKGAKVVNAVAEEPSSSSSTSSRERSKTTSSKPSSSRLPVTSSGDGTSSATAGSSSTLSTSAKSSAKPKLAKSTLLDRSVRDVRRLSKMTDSIVHAANIATAETVAAPAPDSPPSSPSAATSQAPVSPVLPLQVRTTKKEALKEYRNSLEAKFAQGRLTITQLTMIGVVSGRFFRIKIEDLPIDEKSPTSAGLPDILSSIVEILSNNPSAYDPSIHGNWAADPEVDHIISNPDRQLYLLQQALESKDHPPSFFWKLLVAFFELLPEPFLNSTQLTLLSAASTINSQPLQFELYQSIYFTLSQSKRSIIRLIVSELNASGSEVILQTILRHSFRSKKTTPPLSQSGSSASNQAAMVHFAVTPLKAHEDFSQLEDQLLGYGLSSFLSVLKANPTTFFEISAPGIRYELTFGDRRISAIARDYLFLKLLDTIYQRSDPSFLPTVLLMHSYFTNSQLLLERLLEYFDHPDTSLDTKRHIVDILRRWVTQHYEELSTQSVWLERLSMFASRLTNDSLKIFGKDFSQSDPTHGHIRAIQQCLKAHSLIRTDLRLANHPRTFVVGPSCPSEDILFQGPKQKAIASLAVQITLLDFDFMSRVVPSELLHRNFQAEERSPNWHRWVIFIDKFRLWCIEHVVRHQQEWKLCLKAMRRIQLLALELHKLQDFNGCFAVLLALTRMSDLKDKMPPPSNDIANRLAVLYKLYSMEKNFSALRTLISSCSLPCVPVAYLLSRDICIIEDAFQNTESQPDTDLNMIALYKLRNLSQSVSKFSDFQNCEFTASSWPRNNDILTYFFLVEVPTEELLDQLLNALVKKKKN